MAKENNIDLKDQNLNFLRNGLIYKVETLKTSNMTVDIVSYEDKKVVKKENIAFAQIPKKLKQKVNPK